MQTAVSMEILIVAVSMETSSCRSCVGGCEKHRPWCFLLAPTSSSLLPSTYNLTISLPLSLPLPLPPSLPHHSLPLIPHPSSLPPLSLSSHPSPLIPPSSLPLLSSLTPPPSLLPPSPRPPSNPSQVYFTTYA